MNRRPSPSPRRAALAVALAGALLAPLAACRKQPEPPPPRPVPPGAPRLVLFLVVDQMRADYLERFRPLLQHGLARLLDESVVFTDAHQDHAATVTATGHATLSTGAFPKHHGIIGNNWYSREEEDWVASIDDPEHGASPHRLLRPTLGDLMKEAWPEAKVYGVGGKSRSAILTAGHLADAAYWYDGWEGEFVTSTWYERSGDAAENEGRERHSEWENGDDRGLAQSRDWMEAFHERKLLDPLFGKTWEPLLPFEEVQAYGIVPLDYGWFGEDFPHPFGGLSLEPDGSFYSSLSDTPFVDAYAADFAKALIDGEQLGADEIPDFLGIAFSMLDSVGHARGPDAHETLDTLLRLDRVIGDLLAFVDERIGLENVVVTLSADHGVVRVPELLEALGKDAGRFGMEQITCFQRAGLDVAQQFGLGGTDWSPAPLYLDREVLSAHQVDPERVRSELGRRLEQCPRVRRAILPSELSGEPKDEILAKFERSYHPERSPDLLVLIAEHTLTTRSLMASHGTPYRYDSHVPFLLHVGGVAPKRIEETVRTVDVVPTLAEILGITDLPDARFDGTSRLALAKEPVPAATDVPTAVAALAR